VTLILAEHSTAMLDGLTSRRLEIRMGRISINDHTTVN
jgi:hypothetical protein